MTIHVKCCSRKIILSLSMLISLSINMILNFKYEKKDTVVTLLNKAGSPPLCRTKGKSFLVR